MKEAAPIFYQLTAPGHPPDFQGSAVVLFFIHISRREKHPQSSSLVFFKAFFHSDSCSTFDSTAVRSQSEAPTAPLFTSTSLTLGRELWDKSPPCTAPYHEVCFAALMLGVYHRYSHSCTTGSASPSSVPFLLLKDHGRHTQAPHYTGPTLPRPVELKLKVQRFCPTAPEFPHSSKQQLSAMQG